MNKLDYSGQETTDTILNKMIDKLNSSKIEFNYSEEINDDEILSEIREICYNYLFLHKIPLGVSEDALFIALEFLTDKFNETTKLKESLNLKTYIYGFTEIAKSLDEMTMERQFVIKDPVNTKLTKDVSNILNEIGILYGIINKIISEVVEERI